MLNEKDILFNVGTYFLVIDGSWGDNGKGKIIELLSFLILCGAIKMNGPLKICIRPNGGNNAGHTVVITVGDKKYVFKLNVVPSSIFYADVYSVIGDGTVVDPIHLFEKEIPGIIKVNPELVYPQNIRISDRAHIVLPHQKYIEEFFEEMKGKNAIGTTKKAIGFAYMDKMARIGLRFGDYRDRHIFAAKLEEAVRFYNEAYGVKIGPVLDAGKVFNDYWQYADRVLGMLADVPQLVNLGRQMEWSGLIEMGQGTMLDIDYGTYPYVTSSKPTVSGAIGGAGLNHKDINTVFLVLKAYFTRVGAGPFPTQMFGAEAEALREKGNEYGTMTGRPRDVGWFDAVVARFAAMINGADYIALTKLDILSGMEKIKICVAYELDGKIIDYPPATVEELARCKPIYIEVPGWPEDISACQSFEDLPENAQNFCLAVERQTGIPIGIHSVGPSKEETIVSLDSGSFAPL